MGARRKARELALQMLFENDVAGTGPDEMFRRSVDLKKSQPSSPGPWPTATTSTR